MKLSIGARSYEVDSSIEGKTLQLVIDGNVHEIPFQRLSNGAVRLVLAHQNRLAWSDGRSATTNGRTRLVQPVASGAAAPVASLAPPMPAVVTAILISVGNTVVKGQKLVLLSAMKTEIAIRSPRDGVVKFVHTSVGQQVMPGKDLVQLA